MHGGNKTPPAEAALPPMGGEGTLLASGPREARSYFGISMQLLAKIFPAYKPPSATPQLPAKDPEHSEPGGAGVRGRGALSGWRRGARGAGAEPSGARGCGFESFGELPKKIGMMILSLNAANKRSGKKSRDKRRPAKVKFVVAPPWIAPQLRAQGHVEARRQKVLPIRGHAAKDRLAVRRDAVARRQGLAAAGAGATKALDLLWRSARRPAIKRASIAER
jgi:hypothetical protein